MVIHCLRDVISPVRNVEILGLHLNHRLISLLNIMNHLSRVYNMFLSLYGRPLIHKDFIEPNVGFSLFHLLFRIALVGLSVAFE